MGWPNPRAITNCRPGRDKFTFRARDETQVSSLKLLANLGHRAGTSYYFYCTTSVTTAFLVAEPEVAVTVTT
jgi:isochorismate synthase EntC